MKNREHDFKDQRRERGRGRKRTTGREEGESSNREIKGSEAWFDRLIDLLIIYSPIGVLDSVPYAGVIQCWTAAFCSYITVPPLSL